MTVCSKPTRFLIHKVKAGDSALRIAKMYGLTLEQLYHYNPWMLDTPTAFVEGIDLSIPECANVVTQGQP